MNKIKIECPCLIKNFDYHKEIKQNLLNLINQSNYSPLNDPGCETDITKTDWHLSKDFNRPWVKYLSNFLLDPMLQIYKDLGYDGYTLHELWFQQYEQLSGHGWHTHSANFTNVYYLDMPDDAPKIQIVNAYNQVEIVELDVKEGDIVVFPSFVIHRSPKNLSNNKKTIISFNTNITYSNKIYGQGLK